MVYSITARSAWITASQGRDSIKGREQYKHGANMILDTCNVFPLHKSHVMRSSGDFLKDSMLFSTIIRQNVFFFRLSAHKVRHLKPAANILSYKYMH